MYRLDHLIDNAASRCSFSRILNWATNPFVDNCCAGACPALSLGEAVNQARFAGQGSSDGLGQAADRGGAVRKRKVRRLQTPSWR